MRITTDKYIKDENGNMSQLVATSPDNLLNAMKCENIQSCDVTTYFGGEPALTVSMTQNDVEKWISENEKEIM